MTKKVRGIDNRLFGFYYMDYDSPCREAEPGRNHFRYLGSDKRIIPLPVGR